MGGGVAAPAGDGDGTNMSILDEIVAHKREEIEEFRLEQPVEDLAERARMRLAPPDFAQALRSRTPGLIAEVKRKSPSAGEIRAPFDAQGIGTAYQSAGAQAVSVLIDRKYFGGGEADFRAVRAAVNLPLLYKEFVVDDWQVWHAASLGASAILLIAAVLDREELERMLGLCAEARLTPLIEVHEEADLSKLWGLDAHCIGINNRDLHTFEVSIETTLRLREAAPAGCTVVSESGIRSADDVAKLKEAGVHAILVGEHLLRQPNLAEAVRDLMSKAW